MNGPDAQPGGWERKFCGESGCSLRLQGATSPVSPLLQGSILLTAKDSYQDTAQASLRILSLLFQDAERERELERQTENLVGPIWPVGLLPLESKAHPFSKEMGSSTTNQKRSWG